MKKENVNSAAVVGTDNPTESVIIAAISELGSKINTDIANLATAQNDMIAELKATQKNLADLHGTVEALNNRLAVVGNDVEKLRADMFEINMLTFSQDGEQKHESYNNLLLEETCALRKDIDRAISVAGNVEPVPNSTADELSKLIGAVSELQSGIDEVKTKLAAQEIDEAETDSKTVADSREALSDSIEELKKELNKIVADFSEM